MRVAFVEPSIMVLEPLGIAYLAQVLMDDGHEVRYFEAPRKNFMKRLKDYSPEVMFFSATTGKHRLCQSLNASIRSQMSAVSLFGGAHCTFYPEWIESDSLIDGICRGEGETAAAELLRKIQKGEDYRNTDNWWLRIDGAVYKNPVRPLIDDLDQLPFPNREVIYAENKTLKEIPIKRILGSRGCPYACSYCFNNHYNALYKDRGQIYRSRSPRNIVEEIRLIRERYPVAAIRFTEDIFGLKMNFDEFASLYAREVGLPFLCSLRPNIVDRRKAESLKRAGCVAVAMAVESANDRVRNEILNRNLTYETLDRAAGILKEAGLRVWTQNIIGSPGETLQMALETLRFNIKHRVDFAECFLLTPYPGTQIHQYCLDHGYFDGDVNALPLSYWLESGIRFQSPRHKRQMINLQKFFSLATRHPALLPLIRVLIEAPPNILYFIFSRMVDGWLTFRMVRVRFGVGSLLRAVWGQLTFAMSSFIRPPR